MERKILSIFIASPSDLNDERKALRNTIERLNKIFGRPTGCQIELRRWEDTLCGYSRPQAIINKDVESCDLFIGILWKRWGTNSGEYSSGFEEEFNLARKRNLRCGLPEIWMFFKKVDEELYKDPGEQLKKTIEFKKKLIESKELLFKEFEGLNDFKDIIFDDLSAYILDLYTNVKKPANDAGTESPNVNITPGEKIMTSNASNEKNNQLIDIFSKLTKCLSNGEEKEIVYWERVRAYLSTSALFSESHIGEIFGSHEANLVYRKRKEWELTLNELWFLTRTYFGSSSNNIPGWFWLYGRSISDIDFILFFLLEHDRNTIVRKGSLLFLEQSKTCPSIELVSKLLEDENQEIVVACLKLLKYCEDINTLKLLEPLFSNPSEEIKNLALSTYIDLLYLYDPEQSFITLRDNSKVVTNAYKLAFEKCNLNVSKNLLISSIFEAAPRIREFAAEYLSKIGLLTKEMAEKILEDSDSRVRKIGFEWLFKNGVEFDLKDISKLFPKTETNSSYSLFSSPKLDITEDDIIPLVLSKLSKEELEEMVDFYFGYGKEAYEALSNKFTNDMADRLRLDLNDHFENIRKKSIDKVKSQFGEQASIILEQRKPNLEEFARDQFTAIAIKCLAKLDEKSNIDIARKYLGKVEFGMADDSCISIMEKCGDNTDIDRLINITKTAYSSTKEKAVSVAIKLSSNPQDLIRELVRSTDKRISERAGRHVYSLKREDGIILAREFLYSENDNVRLLGARFISRHLGRNDIESILDEYIESPTYYYDVVHYFDRYLYAPSKFKDSFSMDTADVEEF